MRRKQETKKQKNALLKSKRGARIDRKKTGYGIFCSMWNSNFSIFIWTFPEQNLGFLVAASRWDTFDMIEITGRVGEVLAVDTNVWLKNIASNEVWLRNETLNRCSQCVITEISPSLIIVLYVYKFSMGKFHFHQFYSFKDLPATKQIPQKIGHFCQRNRKAY